MPESSMPEEQHAANIKQLKSAARHFTSYNLIRKGNLDIFERVYYMRAIVGIAAGVITGLVISSVLPFNSSGQDQRATIAITLGMALMFYFISFGIGKSIAKNVPKDKRRKVATDGIVPFIFLLLTFMIIVYTALHQSVLLG
jgi:ACR3 family arsenite efflux pump ArsB